MVPSNRLPRWIILAFLMFPLVPGAAQDDGSLPEAPTRELTPEEIERDRLLEIAYPEAYLDSDEERLLVASGAARRVESTPFAVTVITGARLREMAYTTLADALVGLVGIYPDWCYRMGQYAGVGIRCSPTQRLRVLMDGMPLNHGSNWLEALSLVPLNLIRRVEILRGPGGGLYASGLGGVINVVTRNPQRLTLALAEAAGGTGSFNNQRYWGRFSSTVWIVGYKVGGYKWNHIGGMDEFERDGGSLDLEVRFDLDKPEPGEFVEGAQIGLYVRTHYSRAGDRWSLYWPRWQDDINLYHYGAFARAPLGDWGDWRMEVRYGESERSRYLLGQDYRFQSEDQSELDTSYYTKNSIDAATRLDVSPWRGGRIGLILDGFWEGSGNLQSLGPYNLGAALQLEQDFYDGMTQFIGGVRLDQNDSRPMMPTFRCGLLQGFPHLHGTDSVFVNFANGFRFPTDEERDRSLGHLDPEIGWELEGGVRVSRLAPLTCQLTTFYREVTNAILPGNLVENRAGVTTAYGGEIELALGPFANAYLHRATARSATGSFGWDFPLSLRAGCSLVWDTGVDPVSVKQPCFMVRGAAGFADTFFQDDLTLTTEAVLTYLNERPNLAYPGEPSVEPDPEGNLEHLTLDLYLRARVIDFDISLRLNNLIGEATEYSTAGRLTEPIGFTLTLNWVFYD